MKRIAAVYAVDAIRLANTCDQYDIPRPPPGYWQKLQYGKLVEKPALGNVSFPADEIVVVSTRLPPRQTDRSGKTGSL